VHEKKYVFEVLGIILILIFVSAHGYRLVVVEAITKILKVFSLNSVIANLIVS